MPRQFKERIGNAFVGIMVEISLPIAFLLLAFVISLIVFWWH